MMPPGGVDNGSMAVGVKGVLNILSCPSLGAVAGHQEEGVGQLGAQQLDLLGIGGAGDRAHPVIAVPAQKTSAHCSVRAPMTS